MFSLPTASGFVFHVFKKKNISSPGDFTENPYPKKRLADTTPHLIILAVITATQKYRRRFSSRFQLSEVANMFGLYPSEHQTRNQTLPHAVRSVIEGLHRLAAKLQLGEN